MQKDGQIVLIHQAIVRKSRDASQVIYTPTRFRITEVRKLYHWEESFPGTFIEGVRSIGSSGGKQEVSFILPERVDVDPNTLVRWNKFDDPIYAKIGALYQTRINAFFYVRGWATQPVNKILKVARQKIADSEVVTWYYPGSPESYTLQSMYNLCEDLYATFGGIREPGKAY